MLKEALEYLIGERRPLTVEVDGYTYPVNQSGPTAVERFKTPPRQTVNVVTLSGLAEAYDAGFDSATDSGTLTELAVHVESYKSVSIIPLVTDKFGRRTPYITATFTEVPVFTFNNYYTPEEFLVRFHQAFIPTDNFYTIVKLLSSLSSENSITTSDDGLTQTVVVNVGTVKRGSVEVQPRVNLAPYRTFREANAVESEFLIRMKGKPGELPTVALIEVDGSKWKLDSMLAIRDWLKKALPTTARIIA